MKSKTLLFLAIFLLPSAAEAGFLDLVSALKFKETVEKIRLQLDEIEKIIEENRLQVEYCRKMAEKRRGTIFKKAITQINAGLTDSKSVKIARQRKPSLEKKIKSLSNLLTKHIKIVSCRPFNHLYAIPTRSTLFLTALPTVGFGLMLTAAVSNYMIRWYTMLDSNPKARRGVPKHFKEFFKSLLNVRENKALFRLGAIISSIWAGYMTMRFGVEPFVEVPDFRESTAEMPIEFPGYGTGGGTMAERDFDGGGTMVEHGPNGSEVEDQPGFIS
ncbi:hypothetical protein ACFLY6_01240 [Candidatus Dependentiae bacterium]